MRRERKFFKSGMVAMLAAGMLAMTSFGLPAKAASTRNTVSVSKVSDNGVITLDDNNTVENSFEVAYYGATSSDGKTAVIPDNITILGTKYKVTSIADEAFSGNRLVRKIVVGRNVEAIGVDAFYNCKNLRKITFKTTKLKDVNIGEDSFRKAGYKNGKKLIIKTPKGKKSYYKKIFRANGLSKKAKVR
ncbi:MAG: leucine-rich repeat protein [Lachnospiraceae bacterium]|nr:leucine-rich repeat protein [Lachnospiraceae bacterium]